MKQFIADAVTVFVENGTTFILSPNGDRLGKLTGVTLVDNYNDTPTVTITLYCNVVGSELEANQKYKAAKLAELRRELERQEKELARQALEATRKFKDGDYVVTCKEVTGMYDYWGTIRNARYYDTVADPAGGWYYEVVPDRPELPTIRRKESEISLAI